MSGNNKNRRVPINDVHVAIRKITNSEISKQVSDYKPT
jgi:hypothetical protein